MYCPFCQHADTRVIDSRVSEDGATIRRRRECEACNERFSTLETIELKLPAIVKSDGSREAFDARKVRSGFDRALQKRAVAAIAGVGLLIVAAVLYGMQPGGWYFGDAPVWSWVSGAAGLFSLASAWWRR